MTDKKTLRFRVVKYLVIFNYFVALFCFIAVLIFGPHMINNEKNIRGVKDLPNEDNIYQHFQHGGFAFIIAGIIIILIVLFFIYGAFIESFKINIIMAIFLAFVDVMNLPFYEDYKIITLFSLWTTFLLFYFAYLIKREEKDSLSNDVEIREVSDVENKP